MIPSYRPFAVLALAGLITTVAVRGDPPAPMEPAKSTSPAKADPPAPMEPAKSPAPAKIDLHRLKNEELLAKATALLDKASQTYLAQLRELATLERALDRARKRTEDVKVPPPPPNGADNKPTPLEAARKAAELSRARRDALKRLQERLAAEKKLLDDLGRCVETSRSAAQAFLGTLDQLEAYQLEINLREQDKSLDRDKIPAALASGTDKQRKQIQTLQSELADKTDTVRTAVEEVGKRLTQTDQDALEAESSLVQASARADREQKRQQMEKTFEARKSAELLEELNALIEEEPGLKGAFQLSLQRVEAQQEELARLRTRLEGLKVPAARVPAQVRPEELAAAVKSAANLKDAHEKRIKAIGEVRDASAEMQRRVKEFEADAAVVGEHVFKMQVLARVLGQKEKAGEKITLPAQAERTRLNKAAASLAKAVAAVQAEQDKARKEDADLKKQLAAATTARDETQTRLTALKQAEEATLAAVGHEARLSKMSARDAVDSFTKTVGELKEALDKLKPEQEAHRKAAAAVAELQAKRDALKDPFLREAEELVRPQRQKILAELRKEAALNANNAKTAALNANNAKTTEPKKKDETPKAADPPAQVPPPSSELEKATATLRAFQQRVGSRDRVLEEREQLKKELLAALDEQNKQIDAYAKALNHARQLARQQHTTAVNLKKRVGREELAGKDLPAGLTEALQPALLKRLDADAAELLDARTQTAGHIARLRQVDATSVQAATLRKEIFELVGQRLDLLAELQRLEANYALDRKDRPPLEAKRQQQRAVELHDDETPFLDKLLRLDTSRSAVSLQELLDGYYLELIELKDKDELLDQEKAAVERLLELAGKETEAVKRFLPILDKHAAALMTAHEEESILARARLRPDLADELLKAYQARTGRVLARPQPLTDKEKAEKVEELANRVLDRLAQAEAVKRWSALLQDRLSAAGLKAETGVYQDEQARVKGTMDGNARRVAALTGQGAEDGGSGEIGRVRKELAGVRRENALWIIGKIGLILVAAWFLPRLILWLLGRLFGGGDLDSDNRGLLISSLRAFVRAIVWLVALALILRVLGFDITAILAGLGIGGLAIGLAAKDMIADIISALVIFLERRFKIGDVIRIGREKEPAKVVGLTWRMTQLKGPDGLMYNVPNRLVTDRKIQNLTRQGKTYDSLAITVTTTEEVQPVLSAIREVMDANPDLGPMTERGFCVEKVEHKEGREKRDGPGTRFKVVAYRFWWQIRDFEERNRIRDEVLMRISQRLSAEDMSGTQVAVE
jgi:small-conductance mechanosensitive channel